MLVLLVFQLCSVVVSASACGIHGPGLVAVVLGLVMNFLVMLMSWSVCNFLICCAALSLLELSLSQYQHWYLVSTVA